jgi:hypothetical protein
MFIDMNNAINQLNHFPEKPEYQCFLLDKDNKVLMIGNPVLNQKIWELYKQTIDGNITQGKESVTSVFVEYPEMSVKALSTGKKSTVIYKLKNTGKMPLIISRVDASCGCTVPTWDKKPVKPDEETEIKVEISPKETGAFHKTIQVYCNVENRVIPLIIKGTVEK